MYPMVQMSQPHIFLNKEPCTNDFFMSNYSKYILCFWDNILLTVGFWPFFVLWSVKQIALIFQERERICLLCWFWFSRLKEIIITARSTESREHGALPSLLPPPGWPGCRLPSPWFFFFLRTEMQCPWKILQNQTDHPQRLDHDFAKRATVHSRHRTTRPRWSGSCHCFFQGCVCSTNVP